MYAINKFQAINVAYCNKFPLEQKKYWENIQIMLIVILFNIELFMWLHLANYRPIIAFNSLNNTIYWLCYNSLFSKYITLNKSL